MNRLALLLALAVPTVAWAVPLQLSQSGRFVDADGDALEGAHAITFSLFDAQSGGAPVWAETQTIMLEGGYFHTLLGNTLGNPLDSTLFDGRALWVEVSVPDSDVGLGRQAIASVPYAIRSGWATNLSGGTVDATEIRVAGQTLVDTAGNIVGGGVATADHVHDPADIDAAHEIHSHTVASLGAAPVVHTHSLAALHAAGDDHTHTATEVGASPGDHAHTAADVGAAASVHGHALGDLGAAASVHGHALGDLGAASDDHAHTAADVGAATDDHAHSAGDVGAATDDHAHSAADVGAALEDHGHTPEEAGAAADDHTHTAGEVLTAIDGQDLDLGAATTLGGLALAALLPPVGAILPFAADPAQLPGSWVPCDGRTIADPHPSLRDFGAAAGLQVPNLTDSRFLMGTTYGNLGSTGGTNALSTDGSHTHPIEQVTWDTAPDQSVYVGGTVFHAAGGHDHGGENRPLYLGVLYVIRVE